MNDQIFSTKLESTNNNLRVTNLIEKLRTKLKNFLVLDKQGQFVGEVEDLILDQNRQLNLVVSKSTTEHGANSFLLISKLIQKINPPERVVIVDIDPAEIEDLPEHQTKGTLDIESDLPLSPVTAIEKPADGRTIRESDPFESSVMETEAELIAIPEEPHDLNLEVLEEEIVRLLGERLVVDTSKRKIGEVIVRKQIETQIVQVPIRREKLIVEQVSPEHKQLAEIDLGQEVEIALAEAVTKHSEIAGLDNERRVSGEFKSPKIVSLLLNAIAMERHPGCKKLRLEIIVEDAERQKTYQEWFDRCSGDQPRVEP